MVNKLDRRVLYLFDHTDIGSRLPLALAAIEKGYDVTIGLIGQNPKDSDIPPEIPLIEIPKPENKFSPVEIFKTLQALRNTVRMHEPDILHVVTLKYSFLTGLAVAGHEPRAILYTIAGLGFAFRSEGWKPTLLRGAISPLLKMVLKNSHAWLVIQNEDDRQLLLQGGYADETRAKLVISSGVNTSRFTPMPEPETDEPVVLMVTRLVQEKGVHIFTKAAKILKKEGSKARFQIAGGLTTHNPQAISKEQMENMVAKTGVEWLGRVENIPALLASCAFVVYPSYYGEGVPRVLLEAIAAGRPVITTDHPGCREPVIEGENGYLVPIKDVEATAEAMRKLLSSKELRTTMGKKSRQIAQQQFDVSIINAQTLAVYKQALEP